MEKLVISYQVGDDTYSNEVIECVHCESKDHFGVMFIEEVEKFYKSEDRGQTLWSTVEAATSAGNTDKANNAFEEYLEWQTSRPRSVIVCGKDFGSFQDMTFDIKGKMTSFELPEIQTLEEWFDSRIPYMENENE